MSESRLLVVSDVHGRLPALRWVLKNETADAMFFLGDGLYDLDGAVNLLPRPLSYPVYRARGNCDIGFPDPAEGLAPFGGVLFFYTHGHLYGVTTAWPRPPRPAAPTWRCLAIPTTARWSTTRCRTCPRCSTPEACGTRAATA